MNALNIVMNSLDIVVKSLNIVVNAWDIVLDYLRIVKPLAASNMHEALREASVKCLA